MDESWRLSCDAAIRQRDEARAELQAAQDLLSEVTAEWDRTKVALQAAQQEIEGTVPSQWYWDLKRELQAAQEEVRYCREHYVPIETHELALQAAQDGLRIVWRYEPYLPALLLSDLRRLGFTRKALAAQHAEHRGSCRVHYAEETCTCGAQRTEEPKTFEQRYCQTSPQRTEEAGDG